MIAAESNPDDCAAVRNATTEPRGTPSAASAAAPGSTPHEHSGVARPTNAPATTPAAPGVFNAPANDGTGAASSTAATTAPSATHGAASRTSSA